MSRLTRKTGMWSGALAATAAGILAVTNVGGDEGMRLKTYRDLIGKPTYCFGETEGAVMGRTYTKAQCDALLLHRLDEFAGKVEHCVKAPMSDKTLVAFVGMAYNVGAGGFCGSTTVRLYNAGDRPGACRAMGYWNKAGGRVVPGLTARRARETALCLEGLK
jgi:lysozyme